MCSVFFVLLFITFAEANNISTVNSTTGLNEKVEHSRIISLVLVIKSKGKMYPGMLVTGVAAVTQPEAKTAKENIEVCVAYNGEDTIADCTELVNDTIIDGDVAYLPIFVGVGLSNYIWMQMNETRGKTRKKCVSVAYNHAPYKVDIQGNDVKCGRCNVMDMLSCDDNTLGVLTAKRKILLWEDMFREIRRGAYRDGSSYK